MITQFHVKNFKALKNVAIELSPMHLLIGPNDSGKSSILQAISALCRSTQHGTASIFQGRWTNSPYLWMGKKSGKISLSAVFEPNPHVSEYGIEVSVDAEGRVKLVNEWHVSEGVRVKPEERLNETCTAVMRRKSVEGRIIEREINARLNGAMLIRWNPQTLALPVVINRNRHLILESSGFGLAQFLDDILGADRNRFALIENRYRQIFPQVESIQLQPESAFHSPIDSQDQTLRLTETDGKGIWIKFKGHEGPISASQISEGMLIILAYLALLYSPKPPRIIMIEEPENGIHPQRLREILHILRELISDHGHTQVVMTTHSPDIVAEFSPEEVTLCSKNEEGAVVTKRLSEIPDVQKYQDIFTLGEIWTMKGDEKLIAGIEKGLGVAP